MIKLLIWILLLCGLSAGVIWLTNHPGDIVINWLDYEITAPILIVIVAITAVLLGTILFITTLARLFNIPIGWKHNSEKKKQKRGMTELTSAFTSLATSDATTAERHIKKAEKLLGNTPLTNMLAAQISHAQGKRINTVEQLEKMLTTTETKFVAARALTNLSLQDANIDDALSYAEQAIKSNPDHKPTSRTLFDLYIRKNRWAEAERLINRSKMRRRLNKKQTAHRFALLYFAKAEHHQSTGEESKALPLYENSIKYDAAFLPAILALIPIYIKQNTPKKAYNIINKAWKTSPHPDLLTTLKELTAKEPKKKQYKYFQSLAKTNPNHLDSKLALATGAITTKQWDIARTQLKSALSQDPQARIYHLLAELERKQNHNESAASSWLAQASDAKSDPKWICQKCNHQHSVWAMHCQSCDSFDSMKWQVIDINNNANKNTPLLLS